MIEKAEPLTRTKGGIVIPEKAQGKVVQGTIVAAGPGGKNQVKNIPSFCLRTAAAAKSNNIRLFHWKLKFKLSFVTFALDI